MGRWGTGGEGIADRPGKQVGRRAGGAGVKVLLSWLLSILELSLLEMGEWRLWVRWVGSRGGEGKPALPDIQCPEIVYLIHFVLLFVVIISGRRVNLVFITPSLVWVCKSILLTFIAILHVRILKDIWILILWL